MATAIVVDEWTDDREVGQLGFRLIQDEEDGALWLEMRVEEGGVWSEWRVEDLDGPGDYVLGRIPALLAAERARIHRELKVEIFAVFEKLVAQAVPGDLNIIEGAILAALDRIVPAPEGKAWLVGDQSEDAEPEGKE